MEVANLGVDPTANRHAQTAGAAFTGLADTLTRAFHLNLLELTASDDPDPVHKARVALRRFRAALTAFSPILDQGFARDMQKRSRALFRVLGDIRDADVMADRLADSARAAEMVKLAVAQRRKARKHLKRKKAAAFRDRVVRRVTGKGWRAGGKAAKASRKAPVEVLAAVALDRAWATCVTNGPDLRTMSPRARHELRKDLKSLRYISEFFCDLWQRKGQDDFLTTLRGLQDDLGALNDMALARSLGHPDTTDGTVALARAAGAWSRLLSMTRWWGQAGGAPSLRRHSPATRGQAAPAHLSATDVPSPGKAPG